MLLSSQRLSQHIKWANQLQHQLHPCQGHNFLSVLISLLTIYFIKSAKYNKYRCDNYKNPGDMYLGVLVSKSRTHCRIMTDVDYRICVVLANQTLSAPVCIGGWAANQTQNMQLIQPIRHRVSPFSPASQKGLSEVCVWLRSINECTMSVQVYVCVRGQCVLMSIVTSVAPSDICEQITSASILLTSVFSFPSAYMCSRFDFISLPPCSIFNLKKNSF